MIIVLKQNAPDVQVHEFCRELEGMGLQINDSKGSDTHILGLIGDTKAIAESWVLANPVVEACRRVSEPYKKANRKFHPDDTVVTVGGRQDRRRQLRRHRRPLLAWRARSRSSTCAQDVQGRRRDPAAGRRVQAPHLPLLLPGHAAAEGLDLLLAGPAGHRPAHRHRDHEHRAPADLFERCGRDPGGCPQHAELRAAQGAWAKMNKPVLLKRGLANTL